MINTFNLFSEQLPVTKVTTPIIKAIRIAAKKLRIFSDQRNKTNCFGYLGLAGT